MKYTHIYILAVIVLVALTTITSNAQVEDSECVECHEASIDNSVHEGNACVECHESIEEIPHEDELPAASCVSCHDDISEIYFQSIHGSNGELGEGDAAACWDCHGSHDIHYGDDEESLIHPKNQANSCGKCHADERISDKYEFVIKNPIEQYEKSVHAFQISEGNFEAATCSDCHGDHDIRMLNDPLSKIYNGNVPETCSRCHQEVYEEYISSEHWKVYQKGVKQAPLCNDCHLEHAISHVTDPESPVRPSEVPTTCASCHDDERLIKRFGLASYRVKSFLDSYHGLAIRKGGAEVANCVSCHGKHAILSQDDPNSLIHKSNLNKTCGTCHPGLENGITLGQIHLDVEETPNSMAAWARIIYIWLIFITISGMILHNGLDFINKVKNKTRHKPERSELKDRYITRFNKTERTIHWGLLSSFIILAWTGFELAYPESFISLFSNESLRRWVHRIAGIIMMLSLGVQFLLMLTTKRGKEQLIEMFPRIRDAKDGVKLILFYLGISKSKPKFGRFSYIEKVEYWALVWGGIVMGITGIGIWYKEVTLRMLPSWSIEFFTVIHFYEAVLATLAIIIWHFYWVIFDPAIYPGSSVFWNGKISLDRLEEEHSLEYEKLMSEEKANSVDDEKLNREAKGESEGDADEVKQ